MDDPNITMEEYIRLEYDEDVQDLNSVETEFPAIVFNDALTSEVTLSCEPMVSPLNDNEIDFRISFDESDDEDYTVIYDKNSFSYKIFSVDDLKTDLENGNDKVNMPSFPSPKPTVNYFDDLDYFKVFEREFPAIVYNDGLTSNLDFLTEPTVSPQHIDEFNLKDETSLSECDEEEQNVLHFNDLFPFNLIYPDDLKSDKDNDNNKIDIKQFLGFICSNHYPKEEHSLPKSRIASLAIRVPLIDPTAKNENPMIEDIQWSRSKAQGERVRSLEASLSAYKYKASSLTEASSFLFQFLVA
ncbi:hypothetical protein Tco_0321217 [Tanacetum coccineum]